MSTPIWPIEGVALESDSSAVAGSLAYRILRMYDDTNQPILCYPTLAAGISIVSSNANWTLGTTTQIIPASTIATDFLLQMITVESMSKDGVYELVIYSGAGDDEVARVRFAIVGGFFGNNFPIPGALIAGDSRVRAALACSTGGAAAATATISLAYRVIT